MQWPWKRFERFYGAAQKRTLIESLQSRKEAMIAALWSNSNYDSQKEGEDAPRQEMIENIEESYNRVIEKIVLGKPLKDTKPKSERPPDDPFGFFAAGRRGEERIYGKIKEQNIGDRTVHDVIEPNDYKELDQG